MHRTPIKKALLAGAAAALLLAACESKEEQAVKFAQSGQEYLEQGDLEKAELQFNNALFKDPINVVALKGAAEVAKQNEQPRRQSRMLQRLLNEQPDDIEANIAIARLMLLGGDGDRALEHAERVLAQVPDQPEALTIKGAVLVVENKVEEATAILNRALEQDPDNAEIFNLLAAGDIRDEDYEKALATINDGIEKAENPETLLVVKLVLAERVLGDEAVIETFEELIEVAPENALYRQRLADFVLLRQRDLPRARELYLETLPLTTEKAPVVSRVVAIDRELGDDAAAEQTLLRYVEAYPEDESLRFAVPIFYCQSAQPDRCREAYQAIASDESIEADQRLRARLGLAENAIRAGNLDEGERLADGVLAEDSENVGALTSKAQILLARAGRDENPEARATEAIGLLRTALNNAPNNEAASILLALAYEQSGQAGYADAQFAQAVDTVGYTKQITEQYRAFLQRRGEQGRSDEVLERYVAANPSDQDALLAKARSDVAGGRARQALEVTQRLQQSGRGTPESERVRLAALMGLERWSDAVEVSTALIEASPDDRRLLAMHARALSEAGSPDDALAFLAARTRTEGAAAGDHILYAEALVREDRDADAVAAARAGLEAFPDNEDLYILAYLATKKADSPAAAVAVLEEASQNASRTVRSRTLLSNDLIVLDRPREAIEVLRSLQSDDALEPLTANNLASLLLDEQGNEAEALRIAERFRGTDNPYFADTLAWAYYKNGRVEDASRMATVAAERAPENADILYHRGVIAAAQGDAPSAESALLAAKRLVGRGGTQITEAEIDEALRGLQG